MDIDEVEWMSITKCRVFAKQMTQKLSFSSPHKAFRSYLACNKKLCYSTNIITRHMAVIYRRCLTKEEHWATARSHHSRFKQAWKKCKRYQVHRLWNYWTWLNQHQSQCSEQEKHMLQELNIAKQGIAWIYWMHRTKVPYWPWAKKDQKIWWHPCKRSKFR